ncbi:MAG: site-specific integrase [Hyphomicrobiales bacterium]|nr:MAG: site-specific integrase [Hyphomicrobiales bacterium]
MSRPGAARGSLRAAKPTRAYSTVAAYVSNGLSENTKRAYAADLRHFKRWGGCVPATPVIVARYLVSCAKTLKVSTLTRRLAAIAHAHAARGLASPTQSMLIRATMRGIKRVHGIGQTQAKPVTLAMLRAMVRRRACYSKARNARDRALLLVGFSGGFRRSELVGIEDTDLQFSHAGVSITLRRSKTDPHGRGRTVALPYCRGTLCPVKALKSWLAESHAQKLDERCHAVFRRVDRYGRIGDALGDAAVGLILKDRIRACGIPSHGFSAHSLRAGLITAAAKAGATTWAIQRQTGHRSESTVHRYIRELSPFARNASSFAIGA